MTSTLLFTLYAIVFLGLISSIFLAAFSYRFTKINNLFSNGLLGLSAFIGVITTYLHLVSTTFPITLLHLTTSVPNITITLSIDHLSAFFLFALCLLLIPISIYTPKYITHYKGEYSLSLFNLLNTTFVFTIVLVLTAQNLITFYIVWEIMSASSYFLANYEHHNEVTQKSSTTYIIMTHLAAALLLVAFLLIYINTGSMNIPQDLSMLSNTLQIIVIILLLIGFGTKAGLLPLHIWLPMAHPAAPSNVSSLMSGIMIKTAIYGFIRFILIPLTVPVWLAATIMVIGILSAICGILYASVENNYKRLMAYSSIENIGIITTALGASMLATALGYPIIATMALMGALFHTLNHTLVKGGLFMLAGMIQYATHTKEIPDLGGLAKKMPQTAICGLILSLAICAVVPFSTFTGEWLAYQSLISLIPISSQFLTLILIATIALLAMTGAVAVLTFVKFYGITFLGTPRTKHAEEAVEVPLAMRIALYIPTGIMLLFSLFPTIVMNLISGVIANTTILPIPQYHNILFNLPIYTDIQSAYGQIDPSFMILILAVVIALTLFIPTLIGGKLTKRYYNTWDCGFTHQTPMMQYSSTAYSNPILVILRVIFRPIYKTTNLNSSPYNRTQLAYEQKVTKPISEYIYAPIIATHKKLAQFLNTHLQNGHIQQYLLYILVTLILLIAYNRTV